MVEMNRPIVLNRIMDKWLREVREAILFFSGSFHFRQRDQRYDLVTEWQRKRSRWLPRGRNRPRTG
jgi:hypothetical protein